MLSITWQDNNLIISDTTKRNIAQKAGVATQAVSHVIVIVQAKFRQSVSVIREGSKQV
jgi:hypothetical protein